MSHISNMAVTALNQIDTRLQDELYSHRQCPSVADLRRWGKCGSRDEYKHPACVTCTIGHREGWPWLV